VVGENGSPTRYYPFLGDPVLRTARKQVQYAIQDNETGEAVMGFPHQETLLPSVISMKGSQINGH
jgi:hypothetical protein